MTQDPADEHTDNVPTDSRLRVLQSVRSSPAPRDTQSVADETGLHPNTVRFHLERLETLGLVNRLIRRTGVPGRPPVLYEAAPVPDAGDQYRNFGHLSTVLAQHITDRHPDPIDESVEAGRAWGLQLVEDTPAAQSTDDALAVVDDHLTQIGFVPEVSDEHDNVVIFQRHCPFLEVAQTQQDVVCSVHLGLMRGMLEGMDAPVVVERLIPFAGPNGCEAYLMPRTINASDAAT